MLLDLASTLARLVRSATLTAVQHATLGPSRPAWTWREESLARFIQGEFADVPADPVDLRRRMEAMALPPMQRPWVRCTDERVAGMKARWYIPRSDQGARDDDPVLLYLHGGGYVFGSLKTHADFIVRLAVASGVRTLAFEYRLAPEHPYPAALDDCLAAYHWLVRRGVDPKRIVVAGESAGGGLTLTSLCKIRDEGDPLPAAAVAISPWCDLAMTFPSVDGNEPYDFSSRRQSSTWGRWYTAGADPRLPEISPLYADPTGLPPLLLQVGSAEMLADEVAAFAHKADQAGVEVTLETWDHMFHIWHFAAVVLPQGAAAIDHIGRFVRYHTSG
jgi:epsilon-lactone hydrolase